MLRKKKTIAQVIATAMIASTFTINVSALEQRSAISSTSSLAGNDRYETAIKISENGWTTSNNAILINGEKGLVDALTATPYASLKDAPILITYKEKLHPSTKARLIKMGVKNVDIVGGAGSISEAVVNELKAMNITVNRLGGSSRYETGLKVAQAMDKISDVSRVAVVNGEKGLPDAVSIAAPAAKNKMPIILANPNSGLDAATKAFIAGEDIYKSYVVGQTASVSETIKNSLPGTKVRLGGTDRHDTNAKVLNEFYTQTYLSNAYIAKSGQVRNESELVDALAVGVLAAKNDVPVLLAGKNLGPTQQSYLKDKKISKITEIGQGVPSTTVQEIKNTQVEAEAKVTGVTVENYKTIKISGSNLNLIDKSKISLSGNSVSDYTVNSSGTQATIVFTSGFSASNTVRITSNLGNTTSHSFSYSSEISSVQATTTKVKTSGIQYAEFTVNGSQKRSVEELNALGWTVTFSGKGTNNKIFYAKDGDHTSATSNTGQLKTSFTNKEVGTYDVVLTKGNVTLKTGLQSFEASDNVNDYTSIKSYDIVLSNDVKITSGTLAKGDTATIKNIKATDKNNNEATLSGSTFKSSNPAVISVNSAGVLTTNSVGSATITITNGDLTKSFTLNVKEGVRKATSASVSRSSVNLIKTDTQKTSEDVILTVKDQYGDVFKGRKFNAKEDIKNSANTTKVATATFSNIPAGELEVATNSEGKININIEADAKGSGSLLIKEGTSTIATIYVSVSDVSNVTSWTFATKGDVDKTLDLYTPVGKNDDNTLTLNLKGYNGSYLVGTGKPTRYTAGINPAPLPVDGLWVKSSDEKILTLDGATDENIVVTAKGKGTATIYAYNGTSSVSSISITVNDSTPVITSINMKDISNITKAGDFDVENLFTTTTSGTKNIVSGISLSGTSEEVLWGTVGDGLNKKQVLFVDRDKEPNGKYEEGTDLLLATIDVNNDFGKEITDKKTMNLVADDNGNIVISIFKGAYDSTKNPFMVKTIGVNIPKQ